LGNSCGRFIIQYYDSSAGLVQPTLIVCCACDAPAPARIGNAAAAAKSHFETNRIIPTPLLRRRTGPFDHSLNDKPFMVQTIRQATDGALVFA